MTTPSIRTVDSGGVSHIAANMLSFSPACTKSCVVPFTSFKGKKENFFPALLEADEIENRRVNDSHARKGAHRPGHSQPVKTTFEPASSSLSEPQLCVRDGYGAASTSDGEIERNCGRQQIMTVVSSRRETWRSGRARYPFISVE